jgi:YidC/Oxa1 family membrane protein insertase
MGDRTRIALAFLIIIGILFIWTMLNRPTQQTAPIEPVVQDTIAEVEESAKEYVEDISVPAEQETIVVNLQHVRVVLSNFGGSVKSFYLKDYNVDIVPPGKNLFVSLLLDSLDKVVEFEYVATDDSIMFKSTNIDEQIVKTYCFDQDYGFSLRVHTDKTPQILSLNSGVNVTEKKNRADDLRNFNVYLKDAKVENITKKIKEIYQYTGDVGWFALTSKYFILMVNNNAMFDRLKFIKFEDEGEMEEPVSASFGCYYMGGAKNRYGAEIENQKDIDISVLLLPMDRSRLAKYERGYEEIASGGFWGPISRVIMAILNLIHSLIRNYGFAIMIFGFLIKLIFFPLSRQMITSQHKMQMVQPELKKIQQKYKEDPQRLNQEMMHLYKTYKVNPFSGCLPLLIQMPIFFALFRTLTTSIEFRQASFIFWITDLSLKDPYYVLPISMGVMMLVQSLTTTVDPRQRLMVIFMPVLMVWIFLNLPSGLQLYWFTYNILTLIEHFVIKRGGLK